ncbi:hypothetical protein OHA77_35990 [Streptosporangium sp. NBC_01639]|uniref:hypothetical protein n=1 Tax=unclassified Streptosporangium TaxID=2632669 RepID=UPI002DDC46BB|nr:hypothetical protein [Streptosporangium sp. NBC_01756]WSC87340.1 hypothetical protein OIE48_03760 [Streptosporangium sp. NBC_01756]WTD53975.1 hypothetical protein OHA77_35990 [Streptosporangium sp. NBC_01639]
MAGIDIHFEALDHCRTTAYNLSVLFGELDGKYPAGAADSSMFGKLADASTLAAVLDVVEKKLGSELGLVRGRLKDLEYALDDVEGNIRKANKASEVAEA